MLLDGSNKLQVQMFCLKKMCQLQIGTLSISILSVIKAALMKSTLDLPASLLKFLISS